MKITYLFCIYIEQRWHEFININSRYRGIEEKVYFKIPRKIYRSKKYLLLRSHINNNS